MSALSAQFIAQPYDLSSIKGLISHQYLPFSHCLLATFKSLHFVEWPKSELYQIYGNIYDCQMLNRELLFIAMYIQQTVCFTYRFSDYSRDFRANERFS